MIRREKLLFWTVAVQSVTRCDAHATRRQKSSYTASIRGALYPTRWHHFPSLTPAFLWVLLALTQSSPEHLEVNMTCRRQAGLWERDRKPLPLCVCVSVYWVGSSRHRREDWTARSKALCFWGLSFKPCRYPVAKLSPLAEPAFLCQGGRDTQTKCFFLDLKGMFSKQISS